GKERQVVLSDACEALLGAIYLDGGLAAAAQRILPLWEPLIDEELKPPRDPKTALQELVQSVGLPLPRYQTISSDGPSHAPHFVVEVIVDGADSQRGEGRSKRAAQTEAAEAMIGILNTRPEFVRSAKVARSKSQTRPTGVRKS
ncbi:MAG: putative dsRNA-binding protein, partial [Pseudomonadota bacterium]